MLPPSQPTIPPTCDLPLIVQAEEQFSTVLSYTLPWYVYPSIYPVALPTQSRPLTAPVKRQFFTVPLSIQPNSPAPSNVESLIYSPENGMAPAVERALEGNVICVTVSADGYPAFAAVVILSIGGQIEVTGKLISCEVIG